MNTVVRRLLLRRLAIGIEFGKHNTGHIVSDVKERHPFRESCSRANFPFFLLLAGNGNRLREIFDRIARQRGDRKL